MGNDIEVSPPGHRLIDACLRMQLVEFAERKDAAAKADLYRDIEGFAADIAGPNPSPVERVLAETAALSWFGARVFESQYVAALGIGEGLSVGQSEHAQRRIERMHRRLLATLKTLATVRRLGGPMVQVNVANQVNVGST